MDLEKVLFVPTLTHSQMYYSRQLAVYNFCVQVGDTGQVLMYVWDETISGRGSNEIGSCLLRVLLSKFTYKRHVLLWCDNCSGQNKNRMIVVALLYLVATKKDFALIEKRKRKVPADIKTLIQKSRLSVPLKVIDMDDGDFYNLTTLANQLLQTTKLNISQATTLDVTTDSLNRNPILKKATYWSIEEWKAVPIAKRKINFFKDIPTNLPKLVTGRSLDSTKKKDFRKMLQFLPLDSRDFYNNIIDT
ncbi:hypothetical protein V9T40_007202 [Parthenolecanium corni]|uniref:Uncharacterized protein n=1 Tax=Parthenolecanium corni TaxID=536013 RepID=A0AAN9YBE7_9HEMI